MGLAKPYNGKHKPQWGELSPMLVGEIKVVSKTMFGIHLGEKLSDLQKRFETTKYSLDRWAVHQTSNAVQDCYINIYKNRVWCITTWLKDNDWQPLLLQGLWVRVSLSSLFVW